MLNLEDSLTEKAAWDVPLWFTVLVCGLQCWLALVFAFSVSVLSFRSEVLQVALVLGAHV
jgi:hypothetical protein